jgi:hypothetical protein
MSEGRSKLSGKHKTRAKTRRRAGGRRERDTQRDPKWRHFLTCRIFLGGTINMTSRCNAEMARRKGMDCRPRYDLYAFLVLLGRANGTNHVCGPLQSRTQNANTAGHLFWKPNQTKPNQNQSGPPPCCGEPKVGPAFSLPIIVKTLKPWPNFFFSFFLFLFFGNYLLQVTLE